MASIRHSVSWKVHLVRASAILPSECDQDLIDPSGSKRSFACDEIDTVEDHTLEPRFLFELVARNDIMPGGGREARICGIQ